MKPSNEDLHCPSMEGEERLEPHEVFVQLGLLVVEGRVPHLSWAAGRGYGEGPHCSAVGMPALGPRHSCDPTHSFLCARAENLRKHLQLLWQNHVPLCVEVLLCPECPCGAQRSQSPEVANIPSPSDFLLEQWLVTTVNKRCGDVGGQMSVRGLFQAVRSQLHFSQLSAWWSSSKGIHPAHVSYRVTVPGEAFASQFVRCPLEHSFPLAVVAKNSAIKVCVRTLPRMDAVPTVPCALHSAPPAEKELEGAVGLATSREDSKLWSGQKPCMKKASPSEPLLGESLLDPPQSLDLFARRYQSPSRCGSPSMEAPEHLMFGRSTRPARTVLARCRDNSPPSPPVSSQHQKRLGRQGLARRRDVGSGGCSSQKVDNRPSSYSLLLPGLVDDRMQNPCNRPGKHHCRCAYDEDLDSLPPLEQHEQRWNRNRALASQSQKQDEAGLKDQEPCPVSDQSLMKGAGKYHLANNFLKEVPPSSSQNGDLNYAASISEKDNFLAGGNKECFVFDVSETARGSLVKRKKIDSEILLMTEVGGKFNLSRREFEEVLAVLKDRSRPPVSSDSKKLSQTPLSSKLQCDEKPGTCCTLKSKAVTFKIPDTSEASPSTASTSDKADMLLGAILRKGASEKSHSVTKNSHVNHSNVSSVLTKNIVKEVEGHATDNGQKELAPNFLNSKPCDNCDMLTDVRHSESAKVKSGNDLTCADVNHERTPCRKPYFLVKKVDLSGIDSNSAQSTNNIQGIKHVQSDIAAKNASSDTLGQPNNSLNNRNHISSLSLSDAINMPETKVKCSIIAKASTQQLLTKEGKQNIHDNVPFMKKIIRTCTISETNKSNNLYDGDQSYYEKNDKLPSHVQDIESQTAHESCNGSNDERYHRILQEEREEAQETKEGHVPERPVPSALDKAKFRRSFDSAASMVFHSRTGLPLTSSPAPVRRGTTCFDFDSSLNSVSAIRSALYETAVPASIDDALSVSSDDTESEGSARSPCSPGAGLLYSSAANPPLWPYYALSPCASLLGSFEESVLNGRLEPVSTVQGFTADLGASGSFCPRHLVLPVTVFFYTLGDNDKVSTPYLGHINLGKKGYNVPRSGTIQVTLLNPLGTVVKMFVVMYDLNDMPGNSQTFIRQRTLYMPAHSVSDDGIQPDNPQKWLRYLIHLRFLSSKSGRVYLHSDIRMIIFRKSDLDTATAHGIDMSYELRSFTHGPTNPKFSPRK